MQIPLCYDRVGTPLYRGGYADVWEGEHGGRKVAVKVLTIYMTSNLGKITRVSCVTTHVRTGRLITDHIEVLQGSHNMEGSSSPERSTAVGGNNDEQPIRNGIRMDDQREYQRIHQVARGGRSVRACRHLVSAADLNSLMIAWSQQLQGIARGLIYMHGEGMIHGDLKGVGLRASQSPFCLLTHSFQGQYFDQPGWSGMSS